MRSYDTLQEAIEDLKRRGFTEDFNVKPHGIECASMKLILHPEDFVVKEYYRFEGMSNPDDNSIVYAIASDQGVSGILVDAYGMYADKLSPGMVAKLKVEHHD